MNRDTLLLGVKQHLSFIVNYFSLGKSSKSNNITVMENFFGDLLNLIYSYNLTNRNGLTNNAIAIDLVDYDRKIVIQVTAQEVNKKDKINSTVMKLNKYYKNKIKK